VKDISKSEDFEPSRQATRESEDKYRMLIEQASDGIHTYDFQGNFIETNSKLCEMLGYTREELLRLNVKDLIPAEDLTLDPIRFDELTTGKTLIRERRLLRKDGSIVPVEISGKMVQDGVLQALIRDITERKKTEEKLKQSEEWLRNILEASRDGILVEENEKIVYVNKSYIQLFGFDTPEELIGQHISIVISAEDAGRVMDFGRNRFEGKQPPTKYEFKGRRKDGTSVEVEASVSTSNTANHKYITTMIRDVTVRKRLDLLMDAQKQSLEMVVKGAPLSDVLIYLTKVVEYQSEGQTAASILLLDEQGHLHNGASPSLSGNYLQAIEGLKADVNLGTCSAAAASAEIVITPDIAADPKWQAIAHLTLEQGFKSAWAMPITARDGRVLGTFGSYFRECRKPTNTERQVVEILGRTAALAIEGKQLEEVLRGNENQLRLITDTIPLLISYVDKEHRYRFVNRTYSEWFGKSRGNIIGRHISDVLGTAAYRTILPEIEKVLSGEEVVFERLIPYEGGERFTHVIYIPKSDSSTGGVTGFYAFAQDITERKKTQEELQRSRDELEFRVLKRTIELEESNKARVKVLHQLVTIQEDERQRIARDLHDQLGQQLTALRLKLKILKRLAEGHEELSGQVDEVKEITRQLDSDVDFLAWQLRPTALDDLGIVAALDYYVRQWSKNFKISTEFDANRFGKTEVAPEVGANIYRIAQEGLNNIYKHARATKVNIFLEVVDDFVVLIIEDNGSGFEKDGRNLVWNRSKGMGLIGMHERAALVGGTIEIESAEGLGTTVYARFPVLSDERN
jgi:PAS domain S-box-containing protein